MKSILVIKYTNKLSIWKHLSQMDFVMGKISYFWHEWKINCNINTINSGHNSRVEINVYTYVHRYVHIYSKHLLIVIEKKSHFKNVKPKNIKR